MTTRIACPPRGTATACRLARPFRAAVSVALLVLAPGAALAQGSAPAPGAAQELSDVDKVYGLSLLWQEVNYNFAFFDQVPDLDWDATYRAFIPRVLATPSTFAYYRELQRFVALLRDGHTSVHMPEALMRENFGYLPPLELQPVEGRMLVRNVGASLAREIPIGSEITALDGVPTTRYLEEEVFPYLTVSTDHWKWQLGAWMLLRGRADTSVRIAYLTPRGERREATLARRAEIPAEGWARPQESTDRFAFRWLEGRVAYVALNTFGHDSVAIDFEAVLPQLREARGLVLDLRRNAGGNSGVGYRVLSWLTEDTLATSRWRTREHRAAHKAWGSYGPEHRAYTEMNAWFDGGTHGTIHPSDGARVIVPTVVLQSHFTGSAAEDFLVAADAIPHFTTVGQLSNGSTGQPLRFALPGGGVGWVVTKRDTYPDGRDFVGVGAIPDVRVEPTVADVRAGRDVVLQRAVAQLRARIRG